MSTKFTEKAEIALNRAVKIAEGYGHTYVGSEHLLLSLCEDEGCCSAVILKKRNITPQRLDGAIRKTNGTGHKTKLSSKETTPRTRRILEASYKCAKRFNSEKIGTEHILYAIFDEGESVAEKILVSIGIEIPVLKDDVLVFLKTQSIIAEMGASERSAPITNLLKYGKNMTACAEKNEYDPLIGRQKETDRLIRILTRKNKNNPCLIGEAGVGKTAIVEGLAQRIASGNVPPKLRGKMLISVDLTSMIAGAKYRGDFEDRIKTIINEAVNNKSVILFIDEIHTIVGAGAAEGAIDAANIMKPQLSRGDLQLIGATTLNEYRKYIEKDSALERRFQPVTVDEPGDLETAEILRGIKERYEEFYGLRIDDEAIEEAVKLSKRYIHDRRFPDKAIDLIDEACAMLVSKCCDREKNNKTDENIRQRYNLERLFDGKTNSEGAHFKGELIFKNQGELSYSSSYLNERECLRGEDIKCIVEELYGIKKCDELNALRGLSDRLKSEIYGQDEAIDHVVSVVIRSSVGIINDTRPKGVFMFIGESGVGKTKLALSLASSLCGDESALVSLDMSEYSEQSSVTKLIGSAPGYVGYDEGNSFLERIKRHPYSVILLDEVDKAHRDVLSLFLQVFDNGYITDSTGRQISFRNAYIIMTSNLPDMGAKLCIGFEKSDEKNIKLDALNSLFPAELLNRIDAVIPFKTLCETALSKISKNQLDYTRGKILELGIGIEYQEGLAEHLGKLARSKRMGARDLGRLISSRIDSKVAELIALGDILEGDVIEVSYPGVMDEKEIYVKLASREMLQVMS